MASFNLELPTDIMKDIQFLYQNSDEIFGNMTKAGAEVAMKNIKVFVAEDNGALAQSLGIHHRA